MDVPPGQLINTLHEILDPVKNGFSIAKVGQLLPNNREVWLDSKFVMVNVLDVNMMGLG